jgi:hypothetical protein
MPRSATLQIALEALRLALQQVQKAAMSAAAPTGSSRRQAGPAAKVDSKVDLTSYSKSSNSVAVQASYRAFVQKRASENVYSTAFPGFFAFFGGRPVGLRLAERPSRSAVRSTYSSPPYGRPRRTQRRNALSHEHLT